jgi:hypothetical protein
VKERPQQEIQRDKRQEHEQSDRRSFAASAPEAAAESVSAPAPEAAAASAPAASAEAADPTAAERESAGWQQEQDS